MSVQWAPSKLKQEWHGLLRDAQGNLCAGCGLTFGTKERGRHSPRFPTLDHVEPRRVAQRHNLGNLLLKHKLCNEGRGDTPPTGCDRVWQMAVHARLRAGGVDLSQEPKPYPVRRR